VARKVRKKLDTTLDAAITCLPIASTSGASSWLAAQLYARLI
jgi:hypothetical protein